MLTLSSPPPRTATEGAAVAVGAEAGESSLQPLVAIESLVSSCAGNSIVGVVVAVAGGGAVCVDAIESLVLESLVFESSSSAGLGTLVPLLVTFSLLAAMSAESVLLSPSP